MSGDGGSSTDSTALPIPKMTANSGQGACMAIEDAFVLGVLLKRYWR